MKKFVVALLAAIVVAACSACSSVVTPKLDERTGTTLEQRCVDYRATITAMEMLDRELTEAEQAAYVLAVTWVTANCPPVVMPGEVVTQ